MAIDLEKFKLLRERSARAMENAAKAAGALEQSMKKIKEDFDCDSIEEAEELLAKNRKELAEVEEQYNEELKKFEDKWGELLK